MGPLAVLVLFAAAADPVRLAAPAFTVSGVEPKAAKAWLDHLAEELRHRGVELQGNTDLSVRLGADKESTLVGCVEGPCLAELAGALDGVLLGSVAATGQTRVITLRIVSGAGQ